jgi:hypothetical protein
LEIGRVVEVIVYRMLICSIQIIFYVHGPMLYKQIQLYTDIYLQIMTVPVYIGIHF